ncbi:MAG TPA: hypothetical protein VGM41_21080 [Chitinophagaceae bacterium]|jgi:hypothetical protein
MNLERYEYSKKQTFKDYFFYSEGPKGRIKKAVRFVFYPAKGVPCYNVRFGDWDEENNCINDQSVTNNGDTEKVLATVGAVIMDFTAIFNEALVYATGSTQARTRRYQMGINKMWDEIEEIFDVYGQIGIFWELFRKNINYDAFIVKRKQLVTLKEPTEKYMTSSTKKEEIKKRIYNDTISDEGPQIRDDDPYTIKKMELMRKSLEKAPLPEELLNGYNRNL